MPFLDKDNPFIFDSSCHKAYNTLIHHLTTPFIIIYPNWSLHFVVMCDGSDISICIVLGKKRDKNFHVIFFASKILNSAQSNYRRNGNE
ncbi:hypothetical protein MA16_Dca022363 [Dendrobium catenatum]|uniref:Reverse transcriptase/retrotransposon-derived protein RNase H-like domain-containing protein n=1 Tax=Dendrobium catenatum TaxID=906689 RepID=A0A2I0VVF6_9ASPA|nr:hypothetical protein MA16_Dca022363 [Dendrobium catenatum]